MAASAPSSTASSCDGRGDDNEIELTWPGYELIQFTFTDPGEPGRNDTVALVHQAANR